MQLVIARIKRSYRNIKRKWTERSTELVLTLGSQMVVLAEQAESLDEARQMLVDAIKQEKL